MFNYWKIVTLSILIILVISFTGCYTIKVGGKAQLAPSDQAGTLVAQKRYWYALYGLIPLGNSSIDNYIPAAATMVRVETKHSFMDGFINLFTGLVTIYSMTAEIYEVK
jgi:hypothetical protein